MRLPFKRSSSESSRISDIELEYIRALFSKFRRIQKLNTSALGIMAEMERVLGGEYIFDRSFIEASIRSLGMATYHIVYCLNAMSGNAYVRLYDRFQEIRDILDDILAGGLGPFSSRLTLPYDVLGWEMEPLVGSLSVSLAEAGKNLELPAPDGFAVTVRGCDLFFEANRHLSSAEMVKLINMPFELASSINSELDALYERLRKKVNVCVRLCRVGKNDERSFIEGISEIRDASPGKAVAACMRLLSEFMKTSSDASVYLGRAALSIHEDISTDMIGKVRSVSDPDFPAGVFRVTASLPGRPESEEACLVSNVFPFNIIQTDFHLREGSDIGAKALSMTRSGLYRGSGLMRPALLKSIAESGVKLERMLGFSPEISWARAMDGRPMILDVRNVGKLRSFEISEDSGDVGLSEEDIILSCGETVQAGVCAAKAYHVKEDDSPERIPFGAVIIARAASPRLAPFLKRASAVITETGSSIGHLATIAREFRVPAIFGMTDALDKIQDGAEITVDAGERCVYAGTVESVLVAGTYGTELFPDDEEYIALKRLLRWITPLRLTGPESSDFFVSECRTYHDIIHFCHECSVEELLGLQDLSRGRSGMAAKRIRLGIPLDLYAIDLGGGLSNTPDDSIGIENILSDPFKAFLEGLCSKDMWSTDPVKISMGDIISGMSRTGGAMESAATSGSNHAIAAENYVNIGLKVGYHYCIIDTYAGISPDQNYIYFRFAGGFADKDRRSLRAGLIRSVLEEMGFRVMLNADLVVAKKKIAEKEDVMANLVTLGKLTGYTRQLDISIGSEGIADSLLSEFMAKAGIGN